MQTLEFMNILHSEAEAFSRMADLEKKLQECLLDKKFFEMESVLAEMQKVSDAITELDARRNLEYYRLKMVANLTDEEGLKDLLAVLPNTDRELLAIAYRNLKIAVMRVQSMAQGIDAYSRHHISLMKGMVDELYPERKRRVYTARGVHRETVSPMVLDRTL